MKLIFPIVLLVLATVQIARAQVPPPATCPSTRPASPSISIHAPATRPSAHLSAALPANAGTVRLRLKVEIGGQPTDMCVVVCVSKKIGATPGRVPTMFYLGGLGDHGFMGDGVLRNGPPAEMMRRPYLNDSLPMMVVAPECPPHRRWEEPAMVQAMVELLKIVATDPRVDPDRIYLNGFSNGAIGVWALATEAPAYFAAISSIAGKPYDPDQCAQATRSVPEWVIVGSNDGVFTQGSRAMAAALRKAGGNVVLSEQPNVAHSSWETIYPKTEFYDWFLTFARGKPPARNYTDAELNAIACAPVIDPVWDKARKDFRQFAPFWQLSNFSHDGNPGLRDDINGRHNVFTEKPMDAQANSIMETSWKVPTDKQSTLFLAVGRDLNSDWKLIVQFDGYQHLSIPIDKTTAPNGWYETQLDLSQWKGRIVHIDVLTAPGTTGPTPAYFAKLAIETK